MENKICFLAEVSPYEHATELSLHLISWLIETYWEKFKIKH